MPGSYMRLEESEYYGLNELEFMGLPWLGIGTTLLLCLTVYAVIRAYEHIKKELTGRPVHRPNIRREKL